MHYYLGGQVSDASEALNYRQEYCHNTKSYKYEPRKRNKGLTPDFEASEPVFWRVFKELANQHNGLVTYDLLQGGLISTERLDAGGSVLMIEHILKTGKIEHTEHYHVYGIKMAATTKEEDMR
jgi:hypothetical protein